MSDIYEQVAGELLFTQDVATPAPGPASAAGEHDELIERTDNGPRPADREMEQPPQDPGWRP